MRAEAASSTGRGVRREGMEAARACARVVSSHPSFHSPSCPLPLSTSPTPSPLTQPRSLLSTSFQLLPPCTALSKLNLLGSLVRPRCFEQRLLICRYSPIEFECMTSMQIRIETWSQTASYICRSAHFSKAKGHAPAVTFLWALQSIHGRLRIKNVTINTIRERTPSQFSEWAAIADEKLATVCPSNISILVWLATHCGLLEHSM